MAESDNWIKVAVGSKRRRLERAKSQLHSLRHQIDSIVTSLEELKGDLTRENTFQVEKVEKSIFCLRRANRLIWLSQNQVEFLLFILEAFVKIFEPLLWLLRRAHKLVHVNILRKGRLRQPPGAVLLKLVRFWCRAKNVELIYEPIIAELRLEYFEAIKEGKKGKAVWIRIRETIRFFYSMGLKVLIGLIKGAIALLKIN